MLNIINNQDILKALVVDQENFLESTPTDEQSNLLNNPSLLIRTQIFPYRKVTEKKNKDKVFLTMEFMDFEKKDNKSRNYQRGMITFYVLVPNALEPTDLGSRYDYIVEKLEEIFFENGIGKFEFYRSGDITIDEDYMGAYLTFEITDFYGW